MSAANSLKVTRGAAYSGRPMQYTIDNATPPAIEKWDAEYVNFSGFFGPYNPATFAAAPDLLAALVNCMDILGRAESNASGMGADRPPACHHLYRSRALCLAALHNHDCSSCAQIRCRNSHL
jgi:hypothetical protein